MPAFSTTSLARFCVLLLISGATLLGVSASPGTASASIISQSGAKISINAAPAKASNASLSLTPSACTGTTCTHVTATFTDTNDPITTGTMTDPSGASVARPMPSSCTANAGTFTCELGSSSAAKSISWNFGNLNDLLTVSASSATVDTWSTNAVSIALGDGNDRITGNSSLVNARGDAGDDIFTMPTTQLGSNTIDGGAGNDVLSFFLRPEAVIVTGNTYTGAGTYATIERILGSRLNDVMASASKLEGGDGNDELRALAGAQTLLGGAGDDDLYGYGANSTLMGEAGNDMIFGGSGVDTEHGGDGDDHIYWTSGNDTIFGDAGTDIYDASNAIDPVFICLDSHTTVCGSSYDGLNNEKDLVGSDFEQAIGSPKDDILIGSETSTKLTGLGGDDTFVHQPSSPDSGYEELVGGDGLDFVLVHTDAPVSFSRSGLSGPDGMQNLQVDSETEFFIGAGGRDIYAGSEGIDFFDGQDGDDVMTGGNGHDELYGANGDDRINGGKAADYIEGGAGKDRIDGGPGPDTIIAGDGADIIKVRDGKQDFIDCGKGKDTLIADAKDRVVSCEKIKVPRRRRHR